MEADCRVQWGQLIDFFILRGDLIYRYFRIENLVSKEIDEMIDHFMKGTGKTPKGRYKRQTPGWRVHPCIEENEWLLISEAVNTLEIFESELTPKELESLLTGTLDSPVKAKENNKVSFFLGQLSLKKILPFKWQHLFGSEEKILSAKDGRPLNSKRLRDCWSEVKGYDNGPYTKIKRFVSMLADIINGKS